MTASPSTSSAATPSAAKPPSRSWSPLRIALALFAGVALLSLIQNWPREIERWRQTQAVAARASGDKEEAYRLLAASIDRDPKNASLRVLRADWRMTDDDPEAALADLDAAVAEHATDMRLRDKRGAVNQKLGRHAAAVDDWQQVLDGVKTTDDRMRILYLNNVAYARAVGEIDVERGLKQINEAFKLIESTAKASRSNEQDTRGFLLYRLEKFEDALKDLDPATKEAEETLKRMESLKPPTRERAYYQRIIKEYRRAVAVIRYHRGLVLEKLDQAEKAEADFKRVRELGFEPNEKLQ